MKIMAVVFIVGCGSGALPKCHEGAEIVSTGSGWTCSTSTGGDGGSAQAGSVVIVEAPCRDAGPTEGNALLATFTLPSFSPAKGDTFTTTICAPCGEDEEEQCQFGSAGWYYLPDGGLEISAPCGGGLTAYCTLSDGGMVLTPANEVFLQLTE